MPDNLFGTAAGLLEGAGQGAQANADRNIKTEEITANAGNAASSELGADRRQKMASQDAQKLALLKDKLDQASNMMTITPQIALGLVKNTGDKEWLQAVGQKMRADVAISMYTHGIKVNEAKKSPKITQIYDANGKIRHSVVYTDEDGNQQQLMLDEGITPENLNKGKGGGRGKGEAGKDDTLKKNEMFMRSHEKQAGLLNDPVKSKQLQSTNPDQYNRMKEEYEKDQDRYDELKTSLGQAGKEEPTSGSESSAAPGSAPFDADALIKEALSNK